MSARLQDWDCKTSDRILIFGIGNLGREDDGLGIRLIERLEKLPLARNVELDSNYQLNIEDALLISGFDRVLFLDASKRKDAVEPFSIEEVRAQEEVHFTSHAMGAGQVLALCQKLYGRSPATHLLAIPGYSWGIDEKLSEGAAANLEFAFEALKERLPCTKSP